MILGFRKYLLNGAAILCVVLWPKLSHAESLKEALAAAYKNNPALQSERAKLRATDEGVSEALSDWRPTASAQVQGGISHQVYNETSGNLKPSDANITIAQPIYRGGRTVAATEQAEHTVMQGRAQLVATEQEVLVNAATTYLDLLQNQMIEALYTENQKSLQDALDEVQERSKLGEKTHTDVSQSEARLLRARADLNTAKVNLRISENAYARYVGLRVGSLQEPDIKPVVPATRDEAIALALKNAPAVIAADFSERADGANIDVVKGNLLPELSMVGSSSKAWNENVPQQGVDDNHTENDQLVMRLRVPLYSGGADYARLRAAYETRSQKLKDLEETKLEAQERVSEAWDRMKMTDDNIKLRQEQMKSAEAALEGMKEEERAGDRSNTDRLNAVQELLDSRVSFVQAQHDNAIAIFQLLAATGDFTADRLDLKVALYDPAKHYEDSRDKWAGIGNAGKTDWLFP